MKNKLPNLILFILIISSYCHSQYYISNPVYIEEGRIFTGELNFKGEFNSSDYHYDWTNSSSELLKPIEELKLEISLECDKYLHIYITDKNNKRWEHPLSISDSYKEKIKTCSQTKSLKDFG